MLILKSTAMNTWKFQEKNELFTSRSSGPIKEESIDQVATQCALWSWDETDHWSIMRKNWSIMRMTKMITAEMNVSLTMLGSTAFGAGQFLSQFLLTPEDAWFQVMATLICIALTRMKMIPMILRWHGDADEKAHQKVLHRHKIFQ